MKETGFELPSCIVHQLELKKKKGKKARRNRRKKQQGKLKRAAEESAALFRSLLHLVQSSVLVVDSTDGGSVTNSIGTESSAVQLNNVFEVQRPMDEQTNGAFAHLSAQTLGSFTKNKS